MNFRVGEESSDPTTDQKSPGCLVCKHSYFTPVLKKLPAICPDSRLVIVLECWPALQLFVCDFCPEFDFLGRLAF